MVLDEIEAGRAPNPSLGLATSPAGIRNLWPTGFIYIYIYIYI